MHEPQFHSAIVPFLPPGHWILERWDDVSPEGAETRVCTRCGWPIYSRDNGTINTWIETGHVAIALSDETGEVIDTDYMMYCLHCAAHMDYFYPITREWFALTVDGLPQEGNV